MIYRNGGEHANHNATDVVSQQKKMKDESYKK
jgi:hypothetical protein